MSDFNEKVVSEKVTYVGENRPDILISRKTEAKLFKGLRTYNWSKSIGARTQTTDRISNSMYSILQSYNTFQSFASTQNFALSVLGRAAWVVGGRALGRIQGKLVPQGGGPFGRLMRVQAGHMSRKILTGAMKFFISVDFDMKDVKSVQRDITADLIKANAMGPKWQMRTHALAIKNAPNYKLGGFGQGKASEEVDGILSEKGIRGGTRNSQYVQNLVDSGFTASEVTALQRFADGQIDTMGDDQIERVLNAFGKDRSDNLSFMSRGQVLKDFGYNGSSRLDLPSSTSSRLKYDSAGNMYIDTPDIDTSLGGIYTPSDLASMSVGSREVWSRELSDEQKDKEKIRRESNRQARQKFQSGKAGHKGELEKFVNVRKHTTKRQEAKPIKKIQEFQTGVKTYLKDDGKVGLVPRSGFIDDINQLVEMFEDQVHSSVNKRYFENRHGPGGPVNHMDFENHRAVGQAIIENVGDQFTHNNTIYSQRLIQKSIVRDAPLIGGKANENRAFLGFSVSFGHFLKDAQQVEFGGPATDAKGTLKKRTDRFVYPRSLFLTRAGEMAAKQLDLDGDISYGQRTGGVVDQLYRNKNKFDERGKKQNRQSKNEFKLIVDRRLREFNQENAIRARDVRFNERTGKMESVKRLSIQDAQINKYFDDFDKGMRYVPDNTRIVKDNFDGTTSLQSLSSADYPPGFQTGMDKIVQYFKKNANLTTQDKLAGNEFYRRLGRAGHEHRAGIVMGDDHMKAMGLSRNIFGNRPFLDTAMLRNQNLYGGIYDINDVEGAILLELQKEAQPAIQEAYKQRELAAQAFQLNHFRDLLKSTISQYPELANIHLSKNGEVLGLGRGRTYTSKAFENKYPGVREEIDRAKAIAKQKADDYYAKEIMKLENEFQNPTDLGVFAEHFGGGKEALETITNRVNKRLRGVIQQSARYNMTPGHVRASVMKMRSYYRFERNLYNEGILDALEHGRASELQPKTREAIQERRDMLREDVLDALRDLKDNGVTELGDAFRFVGFGMEIFDNDEIVKLAQQAGLKTDTAGMHGVSIISSEDSPSGRRQIRQEALDTLDDDGSFRSFINDAKRKASQGLMPTTAGSSKTNVYGDPTGSTNKGGNNQRGSALNRKGDFRFNLNGENVLPEHRIDLNSSEAQTIIRDYKAVRNKIKQGGFTWVGQTKNVRYYRDVKKSDMYGDSPDTISGHRLQDTLNRLLKNIGYKGSNHNRNVIHLLIALEDDPSVAAYMRATMDPNNPLNNKQYGIAGVKDNPKFGPPQPLDKSKIAYYQAGLSAKSYSGDMQGVSLARMLKNILFR